MTKGNWVSGPNARLGRTAGWAGKKNMVEHMRCARKVGEGILVGQNGKEKRKWKQGRIFGLLKIGNMIQIIFI
jgi:hypothetical protein